MTYDDIQRWIAELRAELNGSILTRSERHDAQATLEKLTIEATRLAAIPDEPSPHT